MTSFQDLTSDFLLVIISFFVTVIGYYLYKRTTAFSIGGLEIEFKEVTTKIAEAAQEQSEASRIKTIENISERLPEMKDISEIRTVLDEIQSQLAREPIVIQSDEDTTWQIFTELVDSYHNQALEQARVQFWISIGAAIVGFSMIIYSAYTIDPQILSAYNILPGAVIDAVAVLFFRQSAETRERATDLYDRLRTDNQRNRAINLVNAIEDVKMRSAVKALMALHMAGQEQTLDLTAYLQQALDYK